MGINFEKKTCGCLAKWYYGECCECSKISNGIKELYHLKKHYFRL